MKIWNRCSVVLISVLSVMPGRVLSEEEALREQLLEDWEYENSTSIGNLLDDFDFSGD